MKRHTHSACTSIMVGRKASIDGSSYIARNEDNFFAIWPKKFYIQKAMINDGKVYTSANNNFSLPLPKKAYRYSTSPDANPVEGLYEEDGINEKNVGMSATESVTANEKVLAYDPLVEDGIAEDSITTVVLPYIDSAREGVERLGEIISKYGSAESNGIEFFDEKEIWYMEVATGHQWVAIRIPDDCYVVAANQIGIEDIDFTDTNNYLWSDGIDEFVEKYQLNPDFNRWDFRHIFGTNTKKDRHYNTPRVWYGQKTLNPSIEQDPESSELPFLRKAEKKISVEDIQSILSSHYNETQFDPLGSGSEEDKKRYRAISLSRTENSHILQLRHNNSKNQAIEWKALGVPSFSPYVPFFTNANTIDESYGYAPEKLDLKSAYWLYETLNMVVESHYSDFVELNLDYQKELSSWARRRIFEVDEQAQKLSGSKLTDYLTEQNRQIAEHFNKETKVHLDDLITKGAELSKLTFKMDPNL
ncbi:C69 family dipeptidase [Companilactobacillus alimentarius]|uniref:Dipeptidase n=1 Tax=Companilactobacillus alimentarius DSM 20249 TaxID=1423720 RepID=A0A2K9HML9_9LACO|nr:C69 family dipeptidase [Companilactobacillus alimentarius]AUI72435.1 dipeptidase [Companilactobacillus alimentarius DSM 20249]MDT6953022.1 C69 family dipeptidase [Companilactobacillus alimentarius]GEO44960.1 dipeptidase [Companilactobacillus alimentarius]